MKIRCLVIDDEPVALDKLRSYVSQTPYLELVAACESPIEAMKVMSEERVDAIFTDINMAGLNGLDYVSSLAKCPYVIFITAYPEYAAESYRINAVDYIVKPYGYNEFQRAAERLRERIDVTPRDVSSADGDSLFVRSDYKFFHIRTAELLYVKGLSDYLILYMGGSQGKVITYATLTSLSDLLPPCFIQVHRSWIINMKHVKNISRNRVIMDDDAEIPVGDTFKDALLQYLQVRTIGTTVKTAKKSD